MIELFEKYVTVIARVSALLHHNRRRLEIFLNEQIVPEFSSKDRFFDVFDVWHEEERRRKNATGFGRTVTVEKHHTPESSDIRRKNE